jgi:universal stress protein A
MSHTKRMLVPTDFSPASDIALDYAIDLAARDGATIHLLHVLDDGNVATVYPDGFYVEMLGLRARLIDEAMSRLKERVTGCDAASVLATVEVAVGRADRVIVERATSRGTDLIVMGTHGRSGFAHLVIGSVAERVVRTAPCPVLTVRNTARTADLLGMHGAREDGATVSLASHAAS